MFQQPVLVTRVLYYEVLESEFVHTSERIVVSWHHRCLSIAIEQETYFTEMITFNEQSVGNVFFTVEVFQVNTAITFRNKV